jgi:hypothetical protein
MKKIIAILLIIGTLIFILSSCKVDNNNPPNVMTVAGANYMPLSQDNTWTYDVLSENTLNNELIISRDSLYVASSVDISGLVYYNLKTSFESTALMSQIFQAGKIRNENNRLWYNGALSLPFEGFEGLSIPLENAVLFDEKAHANFVLSEFQGSYNKTINTIPLESTYTLSTVSAGTMSQFNALNGKTYDEVLLSSINVTLSITTTVDVLGFPLTIDVLKPQNVLEIENVFANKIGLVQSVATIAYSLEDFSQLEVQLPFPSVVNTLSIQELDTATIISTN